MWSFVQSLIKFIFNSSPYLLTLFIQTHFFHDSLKKFMNNKANG